MIKNATIKVALKIKPCPKDKNIAEINEQTGEICITLPTNDTQRAGVDFIHDANVNQETIYETAHIKELMAKFLQGYNIAILTYGQTGSGKTFAFQGSKQHPGIIYKAISEIFSHRSSSTVLKCSFVQLYNQKLTDMLSPETGGERGLRMRWQAQRQFIIQDLTQKQCLAREDMLKQWQIGNKNRVIASNKIHEYSSRSHSIFMVTMEDQDQEHNFRVRQAIFVDLAGSQRVFSPVGRLSKQAIQINKSLFFLRKVILALQEMTVSGKEQYIPYRDSKLTSILKKSFGGNCLTYLIACINPHQDYLEQTLSTIQYSISASKIHNQVNVCIDLKARQFRQLKSQKEQLKRELQAAMMQIEAFKSLERQEEVRRAANSEYANRIIQCIGTVRQLLKSNKALRAQLEQQRIEKKRLAQDLQQAQKNLKSAKKANLQPIKEVGTRKNSKINTQAVQLSQKRKTVYSQSLDLFRRKEKSNIVIRRKQFMLHQDTLRK